ncbi:MAG: RDD family protein [Candidatus Woesearchaeota archaeon]
MLLKRIGAFALDLVILRMFVLFPLDFVILRYITDPSVVNQDFLMQNPDIVRVLIIIWTFYTVLAIIYFSMYEFLVGNTPGKFVFGLKVKGIKTFAQSLVRSLQLFAIIPLWIFDLMPLLYSEQRLFERYSKTEVVYMHTDSKKQKLFKI